MARSTPPKLPPKGATIGQLKNYQDKAAEWRERMRLYDEARAMAEENKNIARGNYGDAIDGTRRRKAAPAKTKKRKTRRVWWK